MPLFVLDIEVQGYTFLNIEAVGINKEPNYGLLGRDVLSRYFLRCDGPNQRFEMEYVSSG